MTKLFRTLLFICLPLITVCQTPGYKISVKLNNYTANTVILGYHFGGKSYIKDTAIVKNKTAVFYGPDKLDDGVYMIIENETNNYKDFLIDGNDQEFSLDIDFSAAGSGMAATGSTANADFSSYLKFLNAKRQELDGITQKQKEPGLSQKEQNELKYKFNKIDSVVTNYQAQFIKNHPSALLSLLIKAGLELTIPTFSGTESEVKLKQFYWYKAHYFDNINLADKRMLHTTVLSEKVNYYIDKLTVQHPDSIIVSVDEILNRTRTSPETFKFFLIDLLNKYARSTFVGMDAVYVHIALEYYNKGAAPWTGKDELEKIIINAQRLEPILIGKKAPDIEMQTLSGDMSRLYNFEAKGTVLFFWDPECNHCKESAVTIVNIEKKLRSKGLRFFTVCTTITPAAVTKAKDFVSSYGMESLHNTVDPYIKSNYKKKYDIQTTPQIFVLDSNKYIRSKRIDADQLEKVIEGLGLLK